MPENIIFIVLILIFIFTSLSFASISTNGRVILEQAYAKQIALLIDEAKPGTTISIDMEDAFEKSLISKNKTVSIIDNKVNVRLRSYGGYSYVYFNDVDIDVDFQKNNLIININEKGAENA